MLVLRASAFRQQGSFQQALEDLEEAREIYCFSQERDQPKRDQGGAEDPSSKENDGIFEHPEITRQRNLTLNGQPICLLCSQLTIFSSNRYGSG